MDGIEFDYCVPRMIKEFDVLPNSEITLRINVSKCGRIQVVFSECEMIDKDLIVNV